MTLAQRVVPQERYLCRGAAGCGRQERWSCRRSGTCVAVPGLVKIVVASVYSQAALALVLGAIRTSRSGLRVTLAGRCQARVDRDHRLGFRAWALA